MQNSDLSHEFVHRDQTQRNPSVGLYQATVDPSRQIPSRGVTERVAHLPFVGRQWWSTTR